MAQDLVDHHAEILAVHGVGVERVPAEGECPIQAPVDRHHGRSAAGHRLDRGHPERLVAAGEDENVRSAEVVRQLFVGDERTEADALLKAQLGDESFELSQRRLFRRARALSPHRQVQNHLGIALGDELEGTDQEIVALVARQTPDRHHHRPVESQSLAQRGFRRCADRKEPVVVVAGWNHAALLRRRFVFFDQHFELGRSRRDDHVRRAVEQPLTANPPGEVVLLLERLLAPRIVALHLTLLPDSQGMGSMQMGRAQDFAQVLCGETGIPVMAVDKLVLQSARLNHAQSVLAPFGELLVEVLLGDESAPTARHADDPHLLAHAIELGLILETPGPDVDLVAQLGELLGQLENVDDLTARVRRTKRRMSGHVAVRRDHGDSRKCREAVQRVIGHLQRIDLQSSWELRHRRSCFR